MHVSSIDSSCIMFYRYSQERGVECHVKFMHAGQPYKMEIRSKQRDPNPKDDSSVRKEPSTHKGFHSAFAALFFLLRSFC